MDDRALIDAAVAAGAVRVIPMGVTLDHADAHRFALPRPATKSLVVKVILLVLEQAERPMTAGALFAGIRFRRYPVGSIPMLSGAAVVDYLRLLEKRGWVKRIVAPTKDRKADRWATTKKAPRISEEAVRKHIRLRLEAYPILREGPRATPRKEDKA